MSSDAILRGRSVRVLERANGGGPKGVESRVASEGGVCRSGSESVVERDLSRVFFCKKRGSGEAFLPDILQLAGVMFHVTKVTKVNEKRLHCVALCRCYQRSFSS